MNSAMLAVMNSPAASSAIISRCDPAQDKLVLALAAVAWPEEERSSRWQTLATLIRAGQGADIVLLAARRNELLVAALIAQALPGRTAVTWLPQFAAREETDQLQLTREMHTRLRQELAARGEHLVQCLEPCKDQRAASLLDSAGFTHAADLLYLAAEAETFPH